jgi:hypothetical protein
VVDDVRGRTQELLSSGGHAEVARWLVELAGHDHALDDAETIVCEVLARGALEPLRQALAGQDGLPLLVRILLADAATRTARCSPDEVHELFTEVSRDGRPEWRLWISAISADFSLWRGDLNGVVVAQAALIGADEHSRGRLHAIARGRLRRLLGLATLLAGFDMRAESDELVAEAQADFARGECTEEAVITRGLFATVLVLMEGDPAGELIPQVRSVVDELLDLGSDRVLLAWVALGWTSGVSFDFATVRECLTALDAAPEGAVWPILRHFVSVLRAVVELEASGPTPQVVKTVVAEFQALNSSLVAGPTAAIYVAGVLLDAGAVDAAAEVMEVAGTPDPSVKHVSGLYRRGIELRIDLYRAPGPATVAAIEKAGVEQAEWGHERIAGEYLLRCAADCRRLGLDADADRLVAIGEPWVPPSRRPLWDRRGD